MGAGLPALSPLGGGTDAQSTPRLWVEGEAAASALGKIGLTSPFLAKRPWLGYGTIFWVLGEGGHGLLDVVGARKARVLSLATGKGVSRMSFFIFAVWGRGKRIGLGLEA